jgi:AraC-like DNA-binding protein
MPTKLLVETHDHAEMVETMRSVYGAGLGMGKPAAGLAFRQEVIIDDDLTIARTIIGAEMTAAHEGFDHLLMIHLRAGRHTFIHTRQPLDLLSGQTAVVPHSVKVRTHLDDADIDLIQIAPSEIERTIDSLYPFASPVPLTVVTPLDARDSGAWWATARAYAGVVSSEDLYRSELVRRTGWNHLLAMTVQLLGLARQRPDATGSEASVRRAEAFIDGNLDQPLTLPAIAAAAAVSTRTLQAAFRLNRDQTPMEYLRKARLDAARNDLTAADPSVASVAGVAAKWGFGNPSRFAARYRDEFGHYPSVDLRA